MQATLLDYSSDKELLLKAWIALSKYPATAREILRLYGSEPEFKDVLRTYGDAVIPVIQYFRENDVWTVKAMQWNAEAAGGIRDRVTGRVPANAKPVGPLERGWAAVNFVKHEGHNFLGQFAVGKDGKAARNQTDRVMKELTSFLTGNVRELETKVDMGEDIAAADIFWAGLDVAMVAVPAKLLAAGKVVARSGQELKLATRTRLFAPRLLSKSPMFRKLGAYGAAAATIYIVATHPSLLNSVFAELANLVGISPWIVQLAGWSVVIGILFYVFSWLLIPLVKFVLFLLRRLERSPKPV
ncbi:MAG: hypothetical protein ABI654_06865 [Betaproteobacteria bacterium]